MVQPQMIAKKELLEEIKAEEEANKVEKEITTEKKKDKKSQELNEIQNKIFDEKKKELEALRKQHIEMSEQMNKTNPYICLIIVVLLFIGFYLYLDRYITGLKDNYLDL